MAQHPAVEKIKFERTFCMVKPDGVMRGAIGDVIHRFEKVGLKIVALKMLTPTKEQVRKHYPMSDDAWVERLGDKAISGFDTLECNVEDVLGTNDRKKLGTDVTEALVEYMTSGPAVAMVIEGIQAIDMVRKLCGHTLPFKADVGTIRGDYSVDSPSVANAEQRSIHNIIHASENAKEAANEISLWFGSERIPSYKLTSDA
ncbi:MAG TPA: nucleoside-diphosphate kinase, partial [Candidatus Saccharibacteria bacterium]|nr:nucleoside-diphosphate kinase [Candidatus Saccharibacteria bacterium]